MRIGILAVVLAGVWLAGLSQTAHADVPLPPPPPDCKPCTPPPPPPAPVPTVGPTAVPAEPVVDVHVADTKLSRGQTQQVSVDASTNDTVTMVVQFRSGKPITFRSRVGSSGTIVKKFKIPKTAPVGKAMITISVKGSASYSKTISFLVTR